MSCHRVRNTSTNKNNPDEDRTLGWGKHTKPDILENIIISPHSSTFYFYLVKSAQAAAAF